MITETEILTHALVGYEAQRDEIERRIEDVRRRLAGSTEVATAEARPAKKKRKLSAAGRAAIVAAAKKRWAKARRAGR